MPGLSAMTLIAGIAIIGPYKPIIRWGSGWTG